MVATDQKTEVVSPAEVPEDLPLPSDPKAIFLGGLFVLAMLAAAYTAREIVLPFVFAIVLKLLLQPTSRILERLHIPRTIAALLLILALFATVVGLGTAISRPRSHLGSQASRGHSSASGAAEFLARACRYAATVLATGRRFWRNRTITNRHGAGAGANSSVETIHGDPKLCQRVFHDSAVSFFPSRVWRYLSAPPG